MSELTKRDEFLRLACLAYGPDERSGKFRAAREALAAAPELGRLDLLTACATGDAEGVRAAVEAEPEAVTRRDGPLGWPPILYLCYGRALAANAECLRALEILLSAGADPNSCFLWGGAYRFTALTGVFGQGERGPYNQPAHPDDLALARCLLQAGADPNDSQALYNRMFLRGSECLRMLLEFGLTPDARCNWLLEDGSRHLETTCRYQLLDACGRGAQDRVAMLLAVGTDPEKADSSGRYPWLEAMRNGFPEIAQLLVRSGAAERPMAATERLAGLLLAGSQEAARAMVAGDTALLARLLQDRPRLLHDAATRGDVGVVRGLLEIGVDPTSWQGSSAVHEALWHGQVAVAQVLVEAGANWDRPDDRFGDDALGWARHGGHPEAVAWMERFVRR